MYTKLNARAKSEKKGTNWKEVERAHKALLQLTPGYHNPRELQHMHELSPKVPIYISLAAHYVTISADCLGKVWFLVRATGLHDVRAVTYPCHQGGSTKGLELSAS